MAVKHFIEQYEYGRYLVPYLIKHCGPLKHLDILEVGCGEAGLVTFLRERGYKAAGLEIDKGRADLCLSKTFPVLIGDIKNCTFDGWDLIIMRDVIEHIDDRKMAIDNARRLLVPGGYLFLSFPPRYSAFGGHQKTRIPWMHVFKNNQQWPTIAEIEECCSDLNVVDCNLFLSRPSFKSRYGLPAIKWPNIKLIRELAMGYECLYRTR
jgi:SAM-dependent methyltransferase